MSYHIVDISTNGVALSVKNGKLICRNPDGKHSFLPMEDVGAVLVNSFSADFHSSFLTDAAKRRISVIICDKFRPVSIVLPVQRATDTLLTRAQCEASERLRRKLWQKTIDAKCSNQYQFIASLGGIPERALQDFRIALHRHDLSQEGTCARLYWDMYAQLLGQQNFRRDRFGGGLNSLLNYGYSVLMLRVAQKLLALGLDPMYGIGHVTRERSLPLVYDLMEPFRVVIDERILKWLHNAWDGASPIEVNRAYKTMIHRIMDSRCAYGSAKQLSLDNILELTIKSFREALVSGQERWYRPWIWSASKWDG